MATAKRMSVPKSTTGPSGKQTLVMPKIAGLTKNINRPNMKPMSGKKK